MNLRKKTDIRFLLFLFYQSIDTLDTWEDMSELGIHLINMPVELKFAKMIFYSVVMKCLSPILVIVATLSTQDPCSSFFLNSHFLLLSKNLPQQLI